MTSTLCRKEVLAVLEWNFRGSLHSRELHPGDRLFVGSDENSDVCIPDSSVAATHCVIFAKSGSVNIEDCYSQAGTYVDAQRIRTVQLSGSTDVKAGTAIISVKLPKPSAPLADATVNGWSAPAAPSNKSSVSRQHAPGMMSGSPVVSGLNPGTLPLHSIDSPESDSRGAVDDLRFQLLQAKEEILILQRRLESSVRPMPRENTDPYQQEMIELLRAEVLELQTTLAEPDHQRCDQTSPASRNEDLLPREEAEKLVQRLEQLLAELQDRDHEIAGLTELLEAAEETNRVEREERTQMDQWVRDIEQRFGCREQEWHEERAQLQKSIDATAAERDRAETVLNADTSSGKLEAAQNMLRGLRETAGDLRKQLADSERMVVELRGRLEQAQSLHSREDRMQLIQERAELARQRQELETLRHQQPRCGTDEAGLKLRALRQHLNEIHEEERAERAEREDRKLSSRISKLWRRLEGR